VPCEKLLFSVIALSKPLFKVIITDLNSSR
jgi:hypothetical protein